jgi:hypothetical protein
MVRPTAHFGSVIPAGVHLHFRKNARKAPIEMKRWYFPAE